MLYLFVNFVVNTKLVQRTCQYSLQYTIQITCFHDKFSLLKLQQPQSVAIYKKGVFGSVPPCAPTLLFLDRVELLATHQDIQCNVLTSTKNF